MEIIKNITLALMIATSIGCIIIHALITCNYRRRLEKLQGDYFTLRRAATDGLAICTTYRIKDYPDGTCAVIREYQGGLFPPDTPPAVCIKHFFTSDRDLNRLMAEELIEKLNEE
ncbi:MAG: hypothetical protein K2J06_08390 [Muribaculaceae bacterium]|nr:hypothetical protein [Muribaculaceae bacterium]